MHWPRIHLPPGYHRNQRIVSPMLPPGVVGQWRAPNLFVDGDMEDLGVSAWTVGNGVMTKITSDPSQGVRAGRLTKDSTTAANIRQSGFATDTMYRLSGWLRTDGSTQGRILDGGVFPIWVSSLDNMWEHFDFIFRLKYSSLRFYGWSGGAGDYTDFDDLYLSVESTPLNWLADGSMEGYGAGSWPIWSTTGTSEKITADPQSGVQALRITRGTGVSYANSFGLSNSQDYQLTGYARSCGNCIPRVYNGIARWTGTTSTDWQPIDITWTSSSTTLRLETTSGGIGGYSDWDSLLLVEV